MRIVVATGASGGHIFPAVSFIEAFRKRYPSAQIRLVLPEQRVSGIDLSGIDTVYLGIPPLRRSPLGRLLVSLALFLRGSFRSLRLIVNFNPTLVIGFGSAPSACVVCVAWLLRVKTMIHEQNVVPGKANLLLARLCDRVAVSFDETVPFLKVHGKAVVTGNPVRRLVKMDAAVARASLGLAPGLATVLVTGGSQGSARINTIVCEALRGFTGKERIQVIHITGKADFEGVRQAYASGGVRGLTAPFLPSMDAAYSAADCVICRAGAATIFELMVFRLPALIVPYPYAYGHQAANAGVLASKNCCRVVRDQELDVRQLRTLFSDMIERPSALEEMRRGYEGFPVVDAAEQLAVRASELAGV